MTEKIECGDIITIDLTKLLNIPWYVRLWWKIIRRNKTKEYKVISCSENEIVIK